MAQESSPRGEFWIEWAPWHFMRHLVREHGCTEGEAENLIDHLAWQHRRTA